MPKFYIKSGLIATHRQHLKINDLLNIFLDLLIDINEGLDSEILAEKTREGLKVIEELTEE